MRNLIGISSIAAAVLAATPAAAMTVLGVYNTGLDATGSALTGNGQSDAHYTIVGGTAAEAVVGAGAKTFAEFDWVAPDTAAAHAINATGSGSATEYATVIYRTSFDLTGFDLATVALAGTVRADDSARVELNGHDLGITAGYYQTTAFQARAANLFNDRINTLDFIVSNRTGHSALRVADLTVTGDQAIAMVPEPASWALFVTGFGLIGCATRRRFAAGDAPDAR